MIDIGELVVFVLDEQRYALRLSAAERAVLAAYITPLPKAPDIVLGVINVRGTIVPVFNVRKRFGLPERELELDDHIFLAKTSQRTVALVVDQVTGVIDASEREVVEAELLVDGIQYVEGVLKLDDGMVFIHDLDRFLSVEEEETLESAMAARSESGQ